MIYKNLSSSHPSDDIHSFWSNMSRSTSLKTFAAAISNFNQKSSCRRRGYKQG